MHMANRSLSAPLNILCDHTDAMGARDTGWVQLYGENGQEAYDNAIQAVRIAEHPQVMLPVMHGMDGFVISHTLERVEVLPDEVVKEFVGTYKPAHSLLDVEHPVTYGAFDHWDYFFEHRRQEWEGMAQALEVIPQVGEEYGRLTGRGYGLFQPYRLDDAELAIVIIGSAAGAARVAIDELRGRRVKAGLLKIRCFRPFPAAAVAEALRGCQAVAVLDRCHCFGGQGGPLFIETCAALFNAGLRPKVVNYIYGLGGRDTVPAQIEEVYADLGKVAKTGGTEPVVRYLGLRE